MVPTVLVGVLFSEFHDSQAVREGIQTRTFFQDRLRTPPGPGAGSCTVSGLFLMLPAIQTLIAEIDSQPSISRG